MNTIFKWLKSLGEKGEVVVTPAPASAATPAASVAAPVVLPAAGGGTPAPVATPPAFTVPDTYKDRPYAKGIDSPDKLWAMLDGAEKKLGERPAGIPADTATPEEWQKFWRSMGAPEKPEEYQLDYGKNADGTLKTAPDAKWESRVKTLMHKYGISMKNAPAVQKDFDAIVAETMKERGIAEQAVNAEFDTIAKGVYGAEYDKMVQRVAPLLQEFTHASLKPGLAKLSPEGLAIVSSIVDNMRAKFIKADGAPLTPAGGGGSGAGTADALRQEARTLMATPAYTNAFDPAHETTKAKINELYQRASQMK